MIDQKLKNIRQTLYLRRDGASSTSMREKGLEYKLNWGVPVTTLRTIASEYYPDPELAGELWKQTTRELKILATMVQDASTFSQADTWIERINNPELAEQAALNLFSRLSDAPDYAKKWIQSSSDYYLLTGISVYIRLFIEGYNLNEEEENVFLASVIPSLNNHSAGINYKAFNALNHYIGTDKQKGEKVIALISTCDSLSELKESLCDEFSSILYDE